ncbi:MAG: outer membrane beta-barrel family protein, partial [Muribaculaceae bacterium]|nr:outer membrane beta-barrel family protein [Muribaculaceae bacterium]
VYDKAADDDYLTQASQKLDRKEDEENLVMDVVLKKEYSIGLVASVEGGYGTDNRYMGKVFGLGFTETARISLFANVNNLNDASEPSDDGKYWYGGRYGNGDTRAIKGGLDYNFEPKGDKFRANGSVTADRVTRNVVQSHVSTLFYPSGDLYRRDASNFRNVSTKVNTRHRLTVRQSVLYLEVRPEFGWSRTSNDSQSREATFNQNPAETSRNEALDSVFARPGSRRYNDILLTRLRSASMTETDALNGRFYANGTLRFPEVPGRFIVSLNGNYDRSETRKDQIYAQAFGGANPSTAVPTNNNRFDDQTPETGRFSASARYERDWTEMGEKRSTKFSINVGSGYNYSRVAHDYNLFAADLEPQQAETALPSLACSPTLIQDLLNSYHSINNDHSIDSKVGFNFSSEPVEQTDSGLNPGFRAGIGLTHKYRSNALDYNTDLPTHESVLRRTNNFSPTASVSFFSSNKVRYSSIYLDYSLSTSDPSLNLFLRQRNTGNPLMIYEYNADNLRSSMTHRVGLYSYVSGRGDKRYYISGHGSFNLTRDAIGNASTYNPLTGVTTYTPMNINGNWTANFWLYGSYSCGAEKQISLCGQLGVDYDNSVDFLTTAADPERSLVKNLNLSVNFEPDYKFKNGSTIKVGFSAEWNNARGTRPDFRPISAMEYWARIGGMAKLPWEMELRSDLKVEWKRGYELAEMNRAQWLWNAELQKSILKGNLTFKLVGRDILGQIRSYSLHVNAQGRYESWTNTIGRYAMLSVIYRFNKSPKKRD